MMWILAGVVVLIGVALAWWSAGRQKNVRVPIRGEETKRQIEAAARLEERRTGGTPLGPLF